MLEAQAPSRITSSSKGLVYLYSGAAGQISILHDGQTWEHVRYRQARGSGGSLVGVQAKTAVRGHKFRGYIAGEIREWSTLTAEERSAVRRSTGSG